MHRILPHDWGGPRPRSSGQPALVGGLVSGVRIAAGSHGRAVHAHVSQSISAVSRNAVAAAEDLAIGFELLILLNTL